MYTELPEDKTQKKNQERQKKKDSIAKKTLSFRSKDQMFASENRKKKHNRIRECPVVRGIPAMIWSGEKMFK